MQAKGYWDWSDTMKQETAFWTSFSSHAPAWSDMLKSGETQAVFDNIDSLLQRYELPFCFDLTMDGDRCCFILSPEGDSRIAERIDALVSTAPVIPGWELFSRRQRKPLKDAYAIVRHLYLVDVSNARFRLDKMEGDPFVEMYLPFATDLTHEEGQGLINTLLWHVLGEDTVMLKKIRSRLILSVLPLKTPTLSVNELVQNLL
jgi:hypothetical protein